MPASYPCSLGYECVTTFGEVGSETHSTLPGLGTSSIKLSPTRLTSGVVEEAGLMVTEIAMAMKQTLNDQQANNDIHKDNQSINT